MIVGVTGHQELGDVRSIEWVRGTLVQQLNGLSITQGLSSLAIGADQLFVEVLCDAQIGFEAIVPCDAYETTFANATALAVYQRLLSKAENVHRLPYPRPSEEAFFAAGKWIVAHSELLIAIWNGQPARGLGGTADIVAVAQAERKPWIHIDPITKTVSQHSGER